MSNLINTSFISDPLIGQPFTGLSLAFLQNSTKEQVVATVAAMIGDNYNATMPYVVYGLRPYGTHQYHPGYMLYQGEVYFSPGKTTTTAFTHVPVMTITVANDPTADPLTFTDNIARNVHNIRTLVMSDAVSGSGTFDFLTADYVSRWIHYAPAFFAYDSSDTLVPAGVTAGSSDAWFCKQGNTMFIYIRSISFSITTGVRYILISTPVLNNDWIPVGTVVYGVGAARLFGGTGTGIPVYSSIELDGSGRGEGLVLRTSSNSDFGAISSFNMSFTIPIGIITGA
jgi:hypothetical protein